MNEFGSIIIQRVIILTLDSPTFQVAKILIIFESASRKY